MLYLAGLHQTFLRHMHLERRTIFIFSWEPWGGMWYSKQHYAAALAKHHTVYFISPPTRWRPRDLFARGLRLCTTPEGVTVVDYRNNLPLRALPKALARRVQRSTAKKLSRLLAESGNICWCFYPEPIALQPALRTGSVQLIYHVVDPYEALELDEASARAADLVVAINAGFLARYALLNPQVLLVPHGVRDEDRSFDPQRTEHYRGQWAPYFVLAGALGKDVNYALLQDLASELPHARLLLAGKLPLLPPDTAEQRKALLELPNVHHVGLLHPNELRNLIRGAQAALIAYDFEPTTNPQGKPGRTPLKAIAYAAQHIPVISSINCHVPELEAKCIFKADDPRAFITLAKDALAGRLQAIPAAIDAYLDRNTYDKLVHRILDALD